MPSDTYHWLAKYYDHLFEFRRSYESARKCVIGPLLPGVQSACDLACGTGTTAIQLARRGIKMFAVDLSPEMCRISREKAREAGVPVRVLRGDMRTFQLPQTVDLLTCEFDALNHVPEKQDLTAVAAAVSRALNPGGHFAFDVNTRVSFEKIWGYTWFLEKDPVAMVMHGGHEPGSDRAWTDVEWFIREGKVWKRHHEHVEEVCWTNREIRHTLRDAGFDRIRNWDAAPFFKDELTTAGVRTFWLARKAPEKKGRRVKAAAHES